MRDLSAFTKLIMAEAAHRDASRFASHLMAATGSSFGRVQRNLLSGVGAGMIRSPAHGNQIQLSPSRVVY